MVQLDKRGMSLTEVLTTLVIFMLISAAIYSFFIGSLRGAATSRRAAYSGQAVERALTLLRLELAGAKIPRTGQLAGELKYYRVRDNENWEILWTIKVENRELVRVSGATRIVLARDIDSFTYTLPGSIFDADGKLVNERLLIVNVRSGNFELEDQIFLRNRQDKN
jgi:prepilin-type N-terminal cleavage/methylation domain-containing protein